MTVMTVGVSPTPALFNERHFHVEENLWMAWRAPAPSSLGQEEPKKTGEDELKMNY